MWFKNGLKVPKLLAQGIVLGNVEKQSRPERAKSFEIESFCPFRAILLHLF